MRGHLLLHTSQYPLVANCIPQLKTGSRHVGEAAATTKSDIKSRLIFGHYQFGRKGIGYSTGPKMSSNKSTKLPCKLASSHLEKHLWHIFISKAVQLQVEGQWTQWVYCILKWFLVLHITKWFLMKVFISISYQPGCFLSCFYFWYSTLI